MITKSTIVDGLRSLGIHPGDKVLVHSSLSSFGYVLGGAKTVVESLLQTVGPEGTVLVPTLTGTRKDSPENPPYFDVRNTPCWTGIISETLRKWPGAVRSLGPTHSVAAFGPDARWLLEGHENCHTPCGEGSPYVKLAQSGGKLVFFGVNLNSNTTLHSAEELAGVPYHLQSRPTRCQIVDESGKTIIRECFLHNWGYYPRRFWDMENIFLEKGFLKIGVIGRAKTMVVESGPMLDFTVTLLKMDPLYMVRYAKEYRDKSC